MKRENVLEVKGHVECTEIIKDQDTARAVSHSGCQAPAG